MLKIPGAAEWKTVAIFLGDNVEIPHKVIKMTAEPAPMTTLYISGKTYAIHDVEEHIDGGFSVFVSRSTL
jgi:hypothetical protein